MYNLFRSPIANSSFLPSLTPPPRSEAETIVTVRRVSNNSSRLQPCERDSSERSMKKSAEKESPGSTQGSRDVAFEEYVLCDEPFYLPVAHEVEIFEAAHARRLPILLKGPTGCGKTRFLEYMSHRLGPLPLITVACHEDLTATDLVGRYLLEGDETRWLDGPLTRAVKAGAICYLDEIVEARKDTIVLIH